MRVSKFHNNQPMRDDYHAWADAELVLDHEADPSQFQRTPWPTSSLPNCQTPHSTAPSDSSHEAENGLSDSECS